MQHQRVAIIGAGTAGLATAAFLARQQHDVTVFDQIPRQEPVGAGLLLQPSGQQVLQQLGLLEEVREKSSRIDGLSGANHWRWPVLKLRYHDWRAGAHGLGVHRAHLARLLEKSARESGATIRYNACVTTLAANTVELNDHERQHFDAVIIANGTRSMLTNALNLPQRKSPYPWGALWAIVEVDHWASPHELLQRYRGAGKMMGILPSGSHPHGGKPCYSLFWSMPAEEYPRWLSRPFSSWQRELKSFWPECAAIIDSIQAEWVYWASYSDVVMPYWHDETRLCIGDSAHAMSPQLGQGVNLALVDAMVLDRVFRHASHVTEAFARYSQQRRAHIHFYQQASRWLTPLYQSHLPIGWLRDLGTLLSCRLPVLKQLNLHVLCGEKSALWSNKSILEST